jgi:outer membrane protein TolC
MPNLQYERAQLELADTHIQAALKHIALMRASIAASRGHGFDTATAEAALAAANDGLNAFLEHRALIEQVIHDIEAGRLPSAPARETAAIPPARP